MIEKRHIGATVIMISILISALGGFIVFQSPEGREDITSKIIDTGPANQQLTILTHSSLSTKESMDPEEIEKELGREIPDWFSSTRITLKDYIITVLSVSVDANEIKLSIDLPLPPGNLEGESGTLVRNSMMYGSMGAVPILPGIRTHVDVEVLLEPSIGEGEPFRETISCETEVVDPERGLLELIDLVEKDMNGWGAGMSRDMEYMLNTLTRIRTTNGWGAG
ncbi:MAG: hypothetical protein U9R75_10600, partial [Candidatus Thermoplasmatota archaeon]|nr:hypothetical protein [Candidatus Thermoplasmatota archaeon]